MANAQPHEGPEATSWAQRAANRSPSVQRSRDRSTTPLRSLRTPSLRSRSVFGLFAFSGGAATWLLTLQTTLYVGTRAEGR